MIKLNLREVTAKVKKYLRKTKERQTELGFWQLRSLPSCGFEKLLMLKRDFEGWVFISESGCILLLT